MCSVYDPNFLITLPYSSATTLQIKQTQSRNRYSSACKTLPHETSQPVRFTAIIPDNSCETFCTVRALHMCRLARLSEKVPWYLELSRPFETLISVGF